MAKKQDAAGSEMRMRVAAAIDRPHLIRLINAAFSVETFLEGTRTDHRRLAAMMAKGCILMAENGEGRLLASVYVERRGKRGYLGMPGSRSRTTARRPGAPHGGSGGESFSRAGM